MSDDLVKQSIAELIDIVRCRCHPAYRDRGMHDPDCDCDSADAVQVVAGRIEELEAQNVRLRELLSGFYASEDIEDLLSGWMIYRKQKGEDRNPPSGTERAKLTDEERLKKQIEELRKRDPFIYR